MANLIEIKEKINQNIKVISFDLFDTILFRTTNKPTDVFVLVAQKALKKKIIPVYMLPEIFRNVRIEAGKTARKNKENAIGCNEVNLREIITCIPDLCCTRKIELEQIEMEIEKEVCYLNPDIKQVIEDLAQERYRIVLISDTYLPKEYILELLEWNNFPIDKIEELFISCEIGKTKQTGELYQYVINELQIQPNEMLHIGDNYMSDIVNAQYQGIQTYYYDTINSNKYMIFQMEHIKYGALLPEISSLRKYVGDTAEKLDSEQRAWFQMGAMVFGPLMTGVAEWVLDTAKERGCSCIFPLMREGMLLSKLLKQAVSFRNENYRIEPLYISRKAVLLPSLGTWDQSAFEKILLMKKATIKTLFELLEMDLGQLEKYKDIKLMELNLIKDDQVTLKEKIEKLLFSGDIIEKINGIIVREKKKFQKYIEQLKPSETFITFDFGIKGTMQTSLFDIFGEQYDMTHLLIFGAKENAEKIVREIDIRGYVGNAGNNDDMVFDVVLRPEIWEQIMMCDLGTTIGYTEDGKPIVKKIEQIRNKQYQKVAWCQDGMLAFQREYLKLKKKKSSISIIEKKVREAANIVFRLITMPTLEEANKLGDLQFDENFGIDRVFDLCDKRELKELKELGVEKWLSKNKTGEIKWEEGVITRTFPTYYFDKEIQKSTSDYEKSIIQIVKRVVQRNPEQVVICGAGEAGRMMQKYLKLYGVMIESFTDNNVKLQGIGIEGIPVKTLKDTFKTNHYVIASFAYQKEISEQIRKIKGEKAEIYSINC